MKLYTTLSAAAVAAWFVTSLILMHYCTAEQPIHQQVWDKNFWYNNNDEELEKALRPVNLGVAKNLVLAIGDGMDTSTTTAIRIYRGQIIPGMIGEEALLSWDNFPHTGISKTYSTDMMTTDSAATATAYLCGVKTKYEMLGVDDTALRKNCSTVEGAKVQSLLDDALLHGKSVGIVTTDAVVGASPSANYAHVPYRNWRADYEMPEEAKGVCKDIARQLVEDNLDIQVILGGGRQYFYPQSHADPEYPDKYGKRLDGRNLVEHWLDAQRQKGRRAAYVTNQEEFEASRSATTDYLLGLFEPARVLEETDRKVNKTEPSLAEMTERAIQILSKNPKGFYLFIEGANIDVAHHESRARKALEEGLAMDDAVAQVVKMTSSDDTLIVVSADHSHAFSFGGYSKRGQSILSVVENPYDDEYKNLDKTGNRFTILSYGNGPGFTRLEDRVNLTVNSNYYDTDQLYYGNFDLEDETHGGADVQIFASGPMSHIFTGVHEQSYIPHAMGYAACIGRNTGHCAGRNYTPNQAASQHTFMLTSAFLCACTLLVAV